MIRKNSHYDESLANFGTCNPHRVQSRTELNTAAERASTVAPVVNGL
jgi:hypothetical protein